MSFLYIIKLNRRKREKVKKKMARKNIESKEKYTSLMTQLIIQLNNNNRMY